MRKCVQICSKMWNLRFITLFFSPFFVVRLDLANFSNLSIEKANSIPFFAVITRIFINKVIVEAQRKKLFHSYITM